MADTVDTIIRECASVAVGIPPDEVSTEMRDVALTEYNHRGEIIWQSWPFDNEKEDEFDISPNSSGVIKFAITVESVRAVWNSDGPVLFQDELIAAGMAESVSEGRAVHLKDEGGCRRIKIGGADASDVVTVLALNRWVKSIVDPNYSAGNPSATPTDYRVATFILDRALPALREFLKDAIRRHQHIDVSGEGGRLLSSAVSREVRDNGRERKWYPRTPIFSRVGRWR